MSDLDPQQEEMVKAVQARAGRDREARRKPTLIRHLGQIGVLGWQIVLPTLGGLALGRWADGRGQSGIFWTGALLVVGLALGCWSAWRWVQRQ